MDVIEKAIAFATKAHEGQVDKVGAPYILHPLAVMKSLSEYPHHVQAAAVLHDVVEDCDVTVEELQKEFPQEVVTLVEAMTRGKEERYFDYIERVKHSGKEAVAIKLADIRHNMNPARRARDAESMNQRYEKAIRILTEAE